MKKYLLAGVVGLGCVMFSRSSPASSIVVVNNNGTVSYEFNEGGNGSAGTPYAYFRSYDCALFFSQPVTPAPVPPPPAITPPAGNSGGNTGDGNTGGTLTPGGGTTPGGGGDITTPPDDGSNPVVTTPTVTVTAVPLPNSAAAGAVGLLGTIMLGWLRARRAAKA
jgi:hypothetical protein